MIKLVVTNDKKYGLLHKGSVLDVNTFEPIYTNDFTTLRSGRFNKITSEKDLDFVKHLKSKFPYTTIGNVIAFHINWKQKFFIRMNKDEKMIIYSGYPLFILKRLMSFIISSS